MTSIDLFDDLGPRFTTDAPLRVTVDRETLLVALVNLNESQPSIVERIAARLALSLNAAALRLVEWKIGRVTNQRDAAVRARDRNLAHVLDLVLAEWRDVLDVLTLRRTVLRARAGWR